MENTIDRKKAARSAFIRSSAFQRLIIIAVLILLYGFFYIASPSFRKYTTLVQICSNMYYTLLMAIGVTFALISGGNDLSMGTGLICYSLIGSCLMRICGWGKRSSIPQKRRSLTLLSQLCREDRKSTRLNSSHSGQSRMPSSA